MSSAPVPIPCHFVSLILQYISPPSAINQPLPPHLLSTPLRQRHHFLQFSPEDVQDYLCWPSSSADTRLRAISLLENLPRIDFEDCLYPVQYVSDTENTYAHVHIPSSLLFDEDKGLRVIFQWDLEGWKYHDTSLMPFPTSSQSDLRLALAISSRHSQNEVESHVQGSEAAFVPELDGGDGNEIDDEDDYWNSYGAQGDDNEEDIAGLHSHPAELHDDPHKSEEAAEAAYWAQYTSVQGTADSTIPSPLPPHRRKAPHFHTHVNVQPQIINLPSRDIPSPHTLSSLLTTLSPRDSHPGSPHPPTSPRAMLTNQHASADGGESSDGSSEETNVLSPRPLKSNSISLHEGEVPSLDIANAHDDLTVISEDVDVENDEALRTSIAGLYRLWILGRRKSRAKADDEAGSKEEFLRVVRHVVDGLS